MSLELGVLCVQADGSPFFQVTGAVFGLAASLITFRGLWAGAEVLPPSPPPVVVDKEEEGGEEKKSKAAVQGVEPYSVKPDTNASGSASSYVEVGAGQA